MSDSLPERMLSLEIGGRVLQLSAPGSADAMLDTIGEGDEIPFWAEVWDSAFGLCSYLAQQQGQWQPGASLLEIGCGVGVVGCAAAALGWRVTMTDYLPEPLQFTGRNLARNDLRADVFQADWRDFPVQERFDLVVGSDVLYERTLHEPLRSLLEQFRRDGSAIILADPGRNHALEFAAAREKEGWPISLEMKEGRQAPVAIFSIGPF